MTALQPLTDQQVQNRLDAYNPGGALERDIRALWEAAGDIIEAEVAEQFGDEAAARTRTSYPARVDAGWIQDAAEFGRRLFAEKSSVPTYIAQRDQLISRIIARMFERFAAEPDRLLDCTLAFPRLAAYETDIILAQVALLEADEAAEQRGEQTKAFERKVTDLVGKGVSQSEALIKRPSSTAAAARGMLGKTSEVAAAAEQSATAMREAAQTAAGLIRAIEDARSEVEVAAGVATRAGDQAEAAVKVSQALSSHVEAIESILGLIRDIAGQTNLLAL